MKASILIMIFSLGFIYPSIAQTIEVKQQQTTQELYDFHISKKKSNNLVGWITLGGGLGLITGGVASRLNNCLFSCEGSNGNGLVYSGIGVGLSSIYFFSTASMHKKKAKIQLQNGAIGLSKEIKYTGISISYSF